MLNDASPILEINGNAGTICLSSLTWLIVMHQGMLQYQMEMSKPKVLKILCNFKKN